MQESILQQLIVANPERSLQTSSLSLLKFYSFVRDSKF